jgi:hypothetical protein
MNSKNLGGYIAFWIEISMKGRAGWNSIEQFDAANLNQSMPLVGIEARGFSVEDDFAHGVPIFEC